MAFCAKNVQTLIFCTKNVQKKWYICMELTRIQL